MHRVEPFVRDYADSFRSGDFDRFARLIDLPYVIVTEGFTAVCTTEDELRSQFDVTIGMLLMHHVDTIEMRIDGIVRPSASLFMGTTRVAMLSNGKPALPGYRGSLVMRAHNDGNLRAVASIRGVSNAYWPMLAPEEAADA